MNFFRSMEIDPTCKFSPPQSRSGGISFYGFSAPRRFHATKTLNGHCRCDGRIGGGPTSASITGARPSSGMAGQQTETNVFFGSPFREGRSAGLSKIRSTGEEDADPPMR
jgi:hypothetical protein